MKSILVIHGGGPTAVINASLYGAVKYAQQSREVKIFAAIGGTGGLLEEKIAELTEISSERLELLLTTPGSAIGTSRDHLEPEDYEKLTDILKKHDIGYVLCNGGNGTMDMCGNLKNRCRQKGYDIKIIGIPKTMDNDLAVTDHSPGFGSAARYLAQSVKEVCADVKGLPIHVVVIEASGRNAGWIAASAALARDDAEDGPDLIYLPELPFSEEQYLNDVQKLIERKKGVVVVASEGLKNKDGEPIVPPVFQVGRSVYFGDVSAHLANLVIQRLGYKARSEKPGLLGRASIALQSPVDKDEAVLAGELACRAALAGESGKMVAFRRVSSLPYQIEPFLADIAEVMLAERTLPPEFIHKNGHDVTKEFCDWCRPLLGGAMPQMISLK